LLRNELPLSARRTRGLAVIANVLIEQLEHRRLLSASRLLTPAQLDVPSKWQATASYKSSAIERDSTASASGLTPAQMAGAYGASSISFGSVKGDGSGQTIAIVDAYDYPTALADLNAFSAYYSLPQFNTGSGSPTFSKFNQNGSSSSLPGTDPSGAGNDWEIEESLDIEWAHALAPKANIDLVEAIDPTGNLMTADQAAANLGGVSLVSNSWGGAEYSGETSTDSIFSRTGVTYLYAAGDDGAFAAGTKTISPDYPAASPDVVAVGGTGLSVGSGNTYGSETAWGDGSLSGTYGGGGGGISKYESIPSYQAGKINGLSTSNRTYPDVSLNASTGVPIFDTYDFGSSDPWAEYGGTSLATPMWAGLLAIANQGRMIAGDGVLTGPTQTLPDLYSLSSADYHDITTGNNGYAATAGYDLATGIGTPIANVLVPALAPVAPVVTTNPTSVTVTAGQPAIFTTAATGNPAPTVQWMVEAAGSSGFTAISGATSNTFSVASTTVAQSGNEYEAVFSNGTGTVATSAPATLTVNPVPVSGSLSGSATTAGASYNLTSLGTADWAHWGVSGTYGTFEHKSTGNSQISNITTVGAGNFGAYQDSSRSVSWTDGTPLATDTADSGYLWANAAIGAGYSFTAPADTTTRTIDIYLGGYSSGGTLTVTLSDSSAAPYTVSFSGSAIYNDVVAITYKAASANQTVTISYVKSQNVSGASGSVDLIGAWLAGGSAATTGTSPAVTSNPQSQTLTAGQDATFAASASGSPTPSVQWMVELAGGTSFSDISGATSTSYDAGAATLAESGNKYEAVFSNGVGTAATTTAATLTVHAAVTSGSLVGSASTAASSYNLTTLGTSDWIHWGVGGSYSGSDHKATGNSQISTFYANATGSYGGYLDPSRGVSWSDGTPVASAAAEDGYVWANNGIGAGFTFTAPADSTTRTLYIYLGGYSSGSTLTAQLTDGSAANYSVSFSGSGIYNDLVAITYKASLSNQQILITYDKSQNINGTSGSTDLIAAWLTGAAASSAPTITTNPTSQTVTAGQAATFTAAASGNPTPTVQWFVAAAGSSNFTAISGATSTTLSLSAVTAAQSGNQYEAVFSNGVGASATTAPATLTVNAASTAGSLTGTASTAAASYNLTPLGTTDWAHWGVGGTYGAFDHKASGNSQISNVTALGSGAYGGYHDASRSLTWNDGTPLASDTADSGYIWANDAIGAGYSFTAPADTTTRTIYVYVGGYSSGSTLTAHLSDSSASDYSISLSGSGIYNDIVAITYKAGSANQKLTISYVKSQNINGASGSSDLVAAWLP
jgi:hypothetical protein